MPKRYNWSGYKALLKLRQRHKRSKNWSAWQTVGRKASSYRKRMIKANKGKNSHTKPTGRASKCSMSPESQKLYDQLLKTGDGKKVLSRFKQFWSIPCPPSIKIIPGGPNKTIPLVGMGHTNEVHISNGDKGERGKKEKVIRGKWNVATEKNGKQVLLLSDRPMSGKLKFVGFAPVTMYIPSPDIESAGTHKKGFVWKHVHGQDDGLKVPKNELNWPKVYADRDGKVDSKSNFVYGATKHGKITTWMYHN